MQTELSPIVCKMLFLSHFVCLRIRSLNIDLLMWETNNYRLIIDIPPRKYREIGAVDVVI